MTRVPGIPLEHGIHLMSYPERHQLGTHLRAAISQLKSIPNPSNTGICNAAGGPIFDYRLPRLNGEKSAGPFHSEADFNKYIVTSERLKSPTHDPPHRIYFTHGDLNITNILMNRGMLSGLVDFGCWGFYPEYWEYTKGVYTSFGPNTAWTETIAIAFPDSYSEELEAERKMWAVTPPF